MVILKLIVTNEIIIAYVTICYDKYIFHGKLGNIVLSLFFFLVLINLLQIITGKEIMLFPYRKKWTKTRYNYHKHTHDSWMASHSIVCLKQLHSWRWSLPNMCMQWELRRRHGGRAPAPRVVNGRGQWAPRACARDSEVTHVPLGSPVTTNDEASLHSNVWQTANNT